MSEEKLDHRLMKMKDSVTSIKEAISLLQDQIDAYHTEKAMLVKNQYIGGTQTGITVAELQKALDYHRTQTLQINRIISDLNKNLTQQKTNLNNAENQLSELNYSNDPERKEVIVLLTSNTDQTLNGGLKYLSNEAGWAPTYDVIAKNINAPIELKYKANIYNNTSINWKNVKMKLSTANPTLGASLPQLEPWSLYYNSEVKEGYFERKSIGKFNSSNDTITKYKTIAVDELNTEFIIEKPYDISSDHKPYLIDINSYKLNATFEYLAIPKIDKDAFLIAKITGWEKLNLIDGPANIYLGESYIGESRIETRLVDDSLSLSLGRDNQILVTRAKRQEVSNKKLIGTNRTEILLYEIVVKNNRTVPIAIEVQDQIPVAIESDITVELIEGLGALLDKQNGKLIWKAKLNAGESVKYNLSYSVKYPKNKNINLKVPRLTPRFL